MKKLVATKNLSRQEWLACRRLGIGGSDASVILGINPYRSVLRLWEDKTGRIEAEQEESEVQHFGNVMEDIVKKEFERRTGMKVRRSNYIYQNEDHPFMIADLDGITKDEEGRKCVFEAKTASEFKKKVWQEGIPPEYMAQVQHYLAVTGCEKAFVAAIVGGNSFYCHEVVRDEEYIRDLIIRESAFWDCVLNGIPPHPDGSEATSLYLSKKYEKTVPDEIELPDTAKSLISRYDEVSAVADEAGREKTEIINRLKEMLGSHETGHIGDRSVTWKQITKSALDTKKVKAALGTGYEDYLTETSYRRFLVA